MYDIKIVDSLFCIFEIDSIVIDQPDDLSVASVVIHPTSGSSNGSVLLEVSGGTGTYSYESVSYTHLWHFLMLKLI